MLKIMLVLIGQGFGWIIRQYHAGVTELEQRFTRACQFLKQSNDPCSLAGGQLLNTREFVFQRLDSRLVVAAIQTLKKKSDSRL